MLGQLCFFNGGIEETALERIKRISPLSIQQNPNGYVVCDSGGKDSNVIKDLVYRSGVPFEIINNHTTADHPLTVRYIREEKALWEARGIRYEINLPVYKGQRCSMWSLIPVKGVPLLNKRWCCDVLKERGGAGAVFHHRRPLGREQQAEEEQGGLRASQPEKPSTDQA